MKRINIEDAKTNLSKLILDVNENHAPIIIENSKGKNAVLISEREWNSINETLNLSSMANDIKISINLQIGTRQIYIIQTKIGN